ncbi:hypothetical protein B4U80_03315 [Leptotrombidium deliense]|uniref:Alpha-macroglobulin receptor-binding domain-containing protein n=1 Tax=Leptotrombidium deliense TaxID=299467 RepID=A0A443S6B9_9ACAR|nr:hypothetical protein B4U80_03315 [Leptotrombidium deliense]
MEVTLPSGFISDNELLETIKNNVVKRTETKHENTEIVIYFEKFGTYLQSLVFKVKCSSHVPGRLSKS